MSAYCRDANTRRVLEFFTRQLPFIVLHLPLCSVPARATSVACHLKSVVASIMLIKNDAAGELVEVLGEAVRWLDALEATGEAIAGRWQVRVQAAAAIVAALATAAQHLPEQLRGRGLQRVFALLGDEAYPARRAGAAMLPPLLRDTLLVRPSPT